MNSSRGRAEHRGEQWVVEAGEGLPAFRRPRGAQQHARAEQVLASAGRTVWIDSEALMDSVTAVSGSGPAYVFLLAEAMEGLNEREREILDLIAQGWSNPAIAERLVLSSSTVRNYVSSILAKLALESRSQAAAYAIRHRLPELEAVER